MGVRIKEENCLHISRIFLILLIPCTIWILFMWFLDAAGDWVIKGYEEERYDHFTYFWKGYFAWIVCAFGAISFRIGAQSSAKPWIALPGSAVAVVSLSAFTFFGFKSHEAFLYDQLPSEPVTIFPERLVADVPDGCNLKRGPAGFQAGFEYQTSCTISAPNGNDRTLTIRRRDLTPPALKGFGIDIIGDDDPGQELNEFAARHDRGPDLISWYATISYDVRPLISDQIPEDFLACISSVEQRADRDDVCPEPPQLPRDGGPYTIINPDGKREAVVRYRCTSWDPEKRQVINAAVIVEETYSGDNLSEDVEDFAKSIFDSLRVEPPADDDAEQIHPEPLDSLVRGQPPVQSAEQPLAGSFDSLRVEPLAGPCEKPAAEKFTEPEGGPEDVEALIRSGQLDAAMDLKRRLWAFGPKEDRRKLDLLEAQVFYLRGYMYLDAGNLDYTHGNFGAAIGIDGGTDPEALNIHSLITAKKKFRPSSALRDVNAALALDPDNGLYLANRCLFLRMDGKLEQALEDCNRALSAEIPTNRANRSWAFLQRGLILHMSGDVEASISDFVEGISLAERAAVVSIQEMLTAAGVFNGPIDGQMSAELEASLGTCIRDDVCVEAMSHEISDIGEVLVFGRKDPAWLNDRALVWASRSGQLKLALKNMNAALALDPDKSFYLANRCYILRLDGQLERALEDCDRALSVELPTHFGKLIWVFFQHALTLRMSGDVEASIPDFVEAVGYGWAKGYDWDDRVQTFQQIVSAAGHFDGPIDGRMSAKFEAALASCIRDDDCFEAASREITEHRYFYLRKQYTPRQ